MLYIFSKCAAVTCVDCSVTFYGDDYAAHISCVSEAEKYEKSLYKAKPGSDKLKPQDIWIALIENIESYSDKASPTVQPFLSRLAALNNVPRNKKKFQNFAKNSMNIRSDHILEEIWNFVESIRQQNEAVTATKAGVTSSSSARNSDITDVPVVKDEEKEEVEDVTTPEELEKQRKKEKKEKKKKRKLAEADTEIEAESNQNIIGSEENLSKKSRTDLDVTTTEDGDETAKKPKKEKKEKKKQHKEGQ